MVGGHSKGPLKARSNERKPNNKKRLKLGEKIPPQSLNAASATAADNEIFPNLRIDHHFEDTPNAMAKIEDQVDISKDIKGILSAISAFKDKAASEVKHKNEEVISSLSKDFAKKLEETKEASEKEREAVSKAVSKFQKEAEWKLKAAIQNLHSLHDKFTDDLKIQFQAFEGKLASKKNYAGHKCRCYHFPGKKDKALLENVQNNLVENLKCAEAALNKKKQEEISIQYLRKTLGSFLNEDGSEEF